MLEYILNRAKEGSTWAGLATAIAGITGLQISTEMVTQIGLIGASVAGLVAMFLKDPGHK